MRGGELRGVRRPVRVEREARRRRRAFWRIGALAALAAGIFFGAAWVSYYPSLQLERITILGVGERRTEMVAEAAVARAFAEATPRLFSPWNILLYPQRALSAHIASSSPRVAGVRVARGGKILLIVVDERQPFARYCSEECVFIDEKGILFPPAVGDPEPAVPTIFEGERAGFALLREALAGVERVGFSVVRARADIRGDATFVLADGAEVLFSLSSASLGAFASLPQTLSAASLRIAEGTLAPPVTYLDLRWRDQVVFKRK